MIAELAIDPIRETERIIPFIAGAVVRAGAKGICLGLSGGLDSAVVAALCARALSPEKVTALLLPERDSSPDSVSDAREFAEKLTVSYRVQDLTAALNALGCYESGGSEIVRLKSLARGAVRLFPKAARKGYLASLGGGAGAEFQKFVAFYRMKHRLRLVAIYREAESRSLIVASCANRTEFETGFFVRYGDDSGEIAPIKHLFKMQVFQLGAHLGLPERILGKKPSPDLFAGMKDEELMGMSYEKVDSILFLLKEALPDAAIASRAGTDEESVRYVKEITRLSQRFREPTASLL